MAALCRVSIGGTMPGGDVWSVNPVFRVGNGAEPPVSSAQASTIVAAISALAVPTGILTMLSTGTFVSTFRAEFRNSNGELDALAEGAKPVPVAGSGTSIHPNQTSLVTSLRTAHVGPSGRGRLFWPATGATGLSSTTGRPQASSVTSWLSAVKTYLSSVNGAITATVPGGELVVWSRKSGVALFNVTSIQMGDVLDTQRRRRDTLIESYQSVSYP